MNYLLCRSVTLMLAVFVGSGLLGCQLLDTFFPGELRDDWREGLSLAEAQDLVPFPICLPQYLPASLDEEFTLIYHADWGDPVEVGSDVRLRYYSADTRELAIEVYQGHTPGEIGTTAQDRSKKDGKGSYYARLLSHWALGEQYTEYLDVIDLTASLYRDDARIYWLFQDKSPVLRTITMMKWIDANITYYIYSRLPVDETKRIVRSMPPGGECREDAAGAIP